MAKDIIRSISGIPLTAKRRASISTDEIATTGNGRDITRPYVTGLQQARDPRIMASVDWGVYERIHEDDQVFSTLQQRKRAVTSRNWSVLPGDDEDPRSVAAAEQFNKTISRLGWDNVTEKMLHGLFTGFATAEILWEPRDGLIDFKAIKVRHARRFRYDADNNLRLLTRDNYHMGEPMPDRHFWTFKAGGNDDDELYGMGLAHWLYWPTVFKRNGIRFWNLFIDKFSSPTAIGKYRAGTPQSQQDLLLDALEAIRTDSGIIVPEGMVIELLEVAKSGNTDFENVIRYMDGCIAKIVLSQTMTTDDGSSYSQANVHAGVKLEVIKSDADLLSESFNTGPARWWTDLNYGSDVASPLLMRDCEEEADTKAQADTDDVLDGLGWERDEESFQSTYGAGYVRKAAAAPDDAATEAADAAKASFAATDKRPLYVHRKLLNTPDIVAWARDAGFGSIINPADLHVTITYSRTPVDWLKMGGYWGGEGDSGGHTIPPGGPRLVDKIGDGGAVALFFHSNYLESRHRDMRMAGASWDYDQYLTHMTLSYDGAELDLTAIRPYQGELRFGPEMFEPLDMTWDPKVSEVSFAETGIIADSPLDTVVDELIAEAGYTAVAAMTDPLLKRILAATSVDEVSAILTAAAADNSDGPFAASLENAMFAAAADGQLNGRYETIGREGGV